MNAVIKFYEQRLRNMHCFYILRLPRVVIGDYESVKPVYKFGITSNISSRMKTHMKNLQFTEVITVVGFNTAETVVELEKHIKKMAESKSERVNIMGNTELIETLNISEYIDTIVNYQRTVDIIDDSKQNEIEKIVEMPEYPRAEEWINRTLHEWGNRMLYGKLGINSIIKNNNNDKTCTDCGKEFTYRKDLVRHRNKKKPCFRDESFLKNINNPNRCIFCNRIFSNTGNKNKHLKTCSKRFEI